jgi:hypothetical protein
MRLARGNRDRPAVADAVTAAAVVDTVAVAKVASEEATRHSHWSGCFGTTAKLVCRGGVLPYALVVVLKRVDAARRLQRHQRFEENLGRAGFEPAKA